MPLGQRRHAVPAAAAALAIHQAQLGSPASYCPVPVSEQCREAQSRIIRPKALTAFRACRLSAALLNLENLAGEFTTGPSELRPKCRPCALHLKRVCPHHVSTAAQLKCNQPTKSTLPVSRNARARAFPPPAPTYRRRCRRQPPCATAPQVRMGTSAHSSGGLPAFDQADPQAYYLIENREELEALSDAVLVAEGVSLCVHSQASISDCVPCLSKHPMEKLLATASE